MQCRVEQQRVISLAHWKLDFKDCIFRSFESSQTQTVHSDTGFSCAFFIWNSSIANEYFPFKHVLHRRNGERSVFHESQLLGTFNHLFC